MGDATYLGALPSPHALGAVSWKREPVADLPFRSAGATTAVELVEAVACLDDDVPLLDVRAWCCVML